jgi:hypothetical protein
MRTNRPNWDHERRVAIIPQEIKLCNRCGGYMTQRYDVYSCSACRSSTFDLVYETDAANYRLNKMTEREEASRLALDIVKQISRYFTEDMFIVWLNTAPADPFDFLDYAQTEANRILAECFEPDDFLREPDTTTEQEQHAAEIAEYDFLGDLSASVFGQAQTTHYHKSVKVMASARWFRHGGTHPLNVEGAAYTWCTTCGEILSLDNDTARAAMPDF